MTAPANSTMVITVTRAEGPSVMCGIPHTFSTFTAANDLLRGWARSMTGPGYDKCDFTLADPAIDLEYRGTFELESSGKTIADLQAHVISNLEFISGEHCPSHMTQATYENLMATMYDSGDDHKRDALLARDYISKLV